MAGVGMSGAVLGGAQYSDVGQMLCLDGSGGVAADRPRLAGWAHAATSQPYVHDLAAGAVPATAILRGGLAFHADGRLYVTTDAVAATDGYTGGLRVRADGALRISTAAVAASDTIRGGWAIKQTGEARMSIV